MLILNVYNKLNDVSLIFKNDRIMRAGIFGYLQIPKMTNVWWKEEIKHALFIV